MIPDDDGRGLFAVAVAIAGLLLISGLLVLAWAMHGAPIR